MSSDWSEVILSEAIEIIGGGTPKTSIDEYWNGDIPWLSVVDFNDSGRFVFDTEKTITENGLNNSSTKILDEGDIIISARGTVGALAQLGKPMAFNQSCYGIRGKNGQTMNDFLYYLLVNTVNNLKRIAHGGVFDTITRSTFDNITVRIPSIAKQKEIASILGSLDQKIHLNQQTNKTLEAMAQAIFKCWFVDFDPVRAKIKAGSAGRDPNRAAMAAIAGISLEQDWEEIEAALDQKLSNMTEEQRQQLTRTAQLFPDDLVESEIGVVPRGWEISEIGKEVNSVGGTTPRTKNPEYWDGGKIAWTTPKDLSNANSKILLETDRKITEEGLDQISSGLLPIDTVLMSSRAPVGYLALSKIPVAINQGYIAMICDKVLTPEYVLHWTESNMDMIKQHAGGSTFSEISKRNFRPLTVLVPREEILSVYSDQVRSFYDSITANMKENEILENLRDTLLPKLISGEVVV